jgi:two-component system sensor histidine kinase YesM
MEGVSYGREHLIYTSPLAINNWKLVITLPVRELESSVWNTMVPVVIIGIISFIVITLISSVILANLSNPLKKVLVSIKEIRGGNLSKRLTVGGCMEVNELCTEFNYMLDTISDLVEKLVNEQKAMRKSELKALRAQINPHLLYNTLDSIKWLIYSGNSEKASQLIAALSTFFRIGLSGGSEEITIKDEVEHVRQYLFIQKLRYNNSISYIIDLEPEVEFFKTPKLILQPIVENAIFHGLRSKEGSGFIKVIIQKKDENTILFEITDNGKGMSPDELANLNIKINSPLMDSTAGSHGYAISNVNQRIKLCYGNQYGATYISKYNIGTKVQLTIPIITQ